MPANLKLVSNRDDQLNVPPPARHLPSLGEPVIVAGIAAIVGVALVCVGMVLWVNSETFLRQAMERLKQ